ncbi:uncharacterized protein LOC130644636 [Hydractinia symbiolongicarpus]|uniref:uncharacterized protein LOC130644636 n=1 Tax=Hydractinia symbiolongicarpus TaxID=13093 RepID=UPI00254A215C|nr:uncharacterized protein LOC130644636 [Hydractinia symbiolongicarpus]
MGNNLLKLPSDINLISATQAEYDFLRVVDKYPALYSTPVLQNAIYRYENYWLPLITTQSGSLPAPLDIEWVWHCHILNPVAYVEDCRRIVNTVVDHKPAMLIDSCRQQSMGCWYQKYPNIPFDVDLSNSTPPLLFQGEFNQKSSYDIVGAAQRQRIFNYNSSLPHYRDWKFLKSAVKRYKIMLQIKRDHPATFIVPCYDNDLVWHTHQQFVLIYQSDTKAILGQLLDHDDSTSDRSPGSHLDKSSEETRKLWRKKGKKFAVSGAMYRGEPPMPLIDKVPNRFASLIDQNKNCFSFFTNQIVRNMMEAPHLKDVLHHASLMAPSSVHKTNVPCQYIDNSLQTSYGLNSFTWRMVHCQKPTLSAVEILDLYGNVVSTAHTIGSHSLPNKKQVSDASKLFTHKPAVERALLIRGSKGDWGILKSSWFGFAKGTRSTQGRLGSLVLSLFLLDGGNSKWYPVSQSSIGQPTQYHWTTQQGDGWVDLQTGNITFGSTVVDVPEYISLGAAIAVSFVLCQPRPPPPKEDGRIGPYAAPPSNRPGVMNMDTMPLLIAGGLYASMLPRWYHTSCHAGYFYQIHPFYMNYHHHHYSGGCGAGDIGYDYDTGGNDFNDVGGWEGGDNGESWDGGDGGGFDSGGGDWGGDAGGCGGCGGGGGCGGSGGGGGCGGGGGGGCGGGGGGGGCGGGGCGGGGCGG